MGDGQTGASLRSCVAANQTDRSAELVSHGYGTGNTASFGEDARGGLYIVNLNGSVWKLVPAS